MFSINLFSQSTDNTNRIAAPPRPRRPVTRTYATVKRENPSQRATHTTNRRPDSPPVRRQNQCQSRPSENQSAAVSGTNPVRYRTTCTSTQRVSDNGSLFVRSVPFSFTGCDTNERTPLLSQCRCTCSTRTAPSRPRTSCRRFHHCPQSPVAR